MKAIATSVAIFTGVSNAAVGGAKLASTTVADQKHGERVRGEASEGLAHDGARICLASRSFGMTFFVVSVIMDRDDRDTYDPDLLVTFLAVAETGSFSEAARRRGLRQSTVSQQVRRLEAETRRRLFDRDTHNVSLTVDGQALTVLAGEILAAYSRAERYFSNAELRGRVRFGASEDFALSSLLPQVLRAFSSRHPGVDIEMTVGLAADLYGHMDEGALDLIFAKRRAGDGRGHMRVARGDGLDRRAGLAARS